MNEKIKALGTNMFQSSIYYFTSIKMYIVFIQNIWVEIYGYFWMQSLCLFTLAHTVKSESGQVWWCSDRSKWTSRLNSRSVTLEVIHKGLAGKPCSINSDAQTDFFLQICAHRASDRWHWSHMCHYRSSERVAWRKLIAVRSVVTVGGENLRKI